jgi:hypothetical protein
MGRSVSSRVYPQKTATKSDFMAKSGKNFGRGKRPDGGRQDARATMHTAKETVRRLLDDLPDNASLEDIQYHIYVREKIERGLRDVEAGRLVDQDEAKRRMAKWLGE